MFADAFIKCGTDEKKIILNELDYIIPNHGFLLPGLMVLKKILSFYDQSTYYEITQADQHPEKTIQIIIGQQKFFICNGYLHDLLLFNQQYPLILDRNNILDYVRFYFAHIVGPHGLSRIIDTVDDLYLKEEPTPNLRKSLHDKIIPLALNASLAGGGYQSRGTLLIEQTIFSVFIDVDPKGYIKVELGRVLADLLPISAKILES